MHASEDRAGGLGKYLLPFGCVRPLRGKDFVGPVSKEEAAHFHRVLQERAT